MYRHRGPVTSVIHDTMQLGKGILCVLEYAAAMTRILSMILKASAVKIHQCSKLRFYVVHLSGAKTPKRVLLAI